MTSVRPPAVAGRFYPADPCELARLVDGLIDRAEPGGRRQPHAIVVPHAGYEYSGAVAAAAYAAVRSDRRHRVVVIGPSHFTPVEGVAAAGWSLWRSPLGNVPVGTAPAGAGVDEAAHRHEHALEVQLPFLQRLQGDALQIVPLAVGGQDCDAAADVLEPLWQDPEVLVVCSTDLSHYCDAATASERDRRTARAVIDRDGAALGPADACGVSALRALLVLARRTDEPVSLLHLATSAEATGDLSRVVGYGAFAVGGAPEPG